MFYIWKGLIKTTKITLYTYIFYFFGKGIKENNFQTLTLYTYVFYLWERYEENNFQTITSSILYKYITIDKSGRLWETFYYALKSWEKVGEPLLINILMCIALINRLTERNSFFLFIFSLNITFFID